jgi:phosphoribosylaminoimidazole carboxylase PurE protein
MTPVAIVLGSDSDFEAMKGAIEVLAEFQVASTLRVLSAHRTPELLRRFVEEATRGGTKVFIAGAGGAAHLAGSVAALTPVPVLGVPLPGSMLNGLDALLSTVQMPAGIPVATFAIGAAGARNAALCAVSILALADADLARRLESYRARLVEKVQAADARVQATVAGMHGAG